jgi:hypothetical protein
MPANVDRLRIATPCPMSWEQMTGNSQVRFCDHCQLKVYNISELSRSEAESLIASAEGRLCARLYRRADGTILTKDCPVGLRALRRRVAKKTTAIFSAILSLSAAVLGQQSQGQNKKSSCTPQTRITRTRATPDQAAKAFAGTVVDQNGASISGAEVRLINVDTKETQQTSTNADGRFEFESLAVGTYSITVKAMGFKTYQLTNFITESNRLINIELILELSGDTVVVGLLLGEPSLIDTSPGTTIITGDMIRRFPIQ